MVLNRKYHISLICLLYLRPHLCYISITCMSKRMLRSQTWTTLELFFGGDRSFYRVRVCHSHLMSFVGTRLVLVSCYVCCWVAIGCGVIGWWSNFCGLLVLLLLLPMCLRRVHCGVVGFGFVSVYCLLVCRLMLG